ncbi:MAG: hypothetical protein L7G96_04655 [Vulcanisaeta sp.]|nr:hypothetical protein [Vulcanisaeta sp.]MCG2887087.1 hypothetical protein [Vulcanisaeta sp.]MCG2894701.1 hypothetical protein [Vulcanisaeta sp.]
MVVLLRFGCIVRVECLWKRFSHVVANGCVSVEGWRIRIKNSAALVNVNAERVVGKVAGVKR